PLSVLVAHAIPIAPLIAKGKGRFSLELVVPAARLVVMSRFLGGFSKRFRPDHTQIETELLLRLACRGKGSAPLQDSYAIQPACIGTVVGDEVGGLQVCGRIDFLSDSRTEFLSLRVKSNGRHMA